LHASFRHFIFYYQWADHLSSDSQELIEKLPFFGYIKISDHQQSWWYEEGPLKGPDGSAGGR